MQILFETTLFLLAIITPALLASNFKSDSAARQDAKITASNAYEVAPKTAGRWFKKRNHAATV